MSWNLFTTTFNVSGQRPTKEAIQGWFGSEKAIEEAQILCFAMQEVPNAEIFNATPMHNTWSEQISNWMNERNFTLVNKLCLASNMLLIYFKSNLLHHIKQIDERWCRSRHFGYKGTISTRVILRDDTQLVFITSHFIAEERFNQERIKQYHQSLNCTFPEDEILIQKYIFWQGDLNFRVEGYTNSSEFVAILSRLDDSCEELNKIALSYDQLNKSKRVGEIFEQFEEAKIQFKPTYRILIGSGSYDPLRIPSWCDRILYWSNRKENIKIQEYSSNHHITLSDHLPVSAHFKFLHPTNPAIDQPCKFEHIPEWEESIPLVCRLSIEPEFWSMHGSNLDWIGIYDSGKIGIVSRPKSWLYLLTCPYDEKRRLVVEFQPLNEGVYKVGYFCAKKKCLQALSNSFNVRKLFY